MFRNKVKSLKTKQGHGSALPKKNDPVSSSMRQVAVFNCCQLIGILCAPCYRLLQLVRLQQPELAEVPSAALSDCCGLYLLQMFMWWHWDLICQEANLSLKSWFAVISGLCRVWLQTSQLCLLAWGRGDFLARWDCGSQILNVLKLLWNSTLKLWFCMCFQSAFQSALRPRLLLWDNFWLD